MTSHRASVLLVVAAGMLAGAGLGVIILFGLGNSQLFSSLKSPWDQQPAPRVGALAPDFELQNLAGETIKLSELRGKPVLINFWATWCSPCRLEMPDIQKIYEIYQGDFLVLAVNADEQERIVAKFAKDIGITFEVLLDPGGDVQSIYQLRGYPTTFLVDGEGVIRVQHIGLLHQAQLVEYLTEVGLSK
jgi:thiol-disulfide isomerase/thioredoxin